MVQIDLGKVVGNSAYESYKATTSDNPVKTEAEWVASLHGKDFQYSDFTEDEIVVLQKPATDAANSTLNMLSSTLSEEEFVMSASASILCGWWNVASPPQATAEQQYWWDGASMHVSVAVLDTKGVITGYTWNPLALSDTAVYIDSSTSAVYQYKNGVMVSFSNITAVIALQLHGINEVLTKINAEV
jgi:hypothetical protein